MSPRALLSRWLRSFRSRIFSQGRVSRPVSEVHLKWLEDLFANKRIYCFCRKVEVDASLRAYGDLTGGPCLMIVVHPLDKDPMYDVLKQNEDEFRKRFGPDAIALFEFWNYFLVHREFARISSDSPDRFFLSVGSSEGQLVEEPVRHLSHHLQVVMIKAAATLPEREKMRTEIRDLVLRFNERSRYLKIGTVATAYEPSKLVFEDAPKPEFTNLPLD